MTETQQSKTPVLIVGGGPVGLMLAAELGWHGIRCTLIEQDDGTARFAKIMAVSVRSMEICRRLGAADRVKNWGFPADFPLDNVFVTSLSGYELCRAPMASMGSRKPTEFSPEYQAHCPQSWFDPILTDLAASFPCVTVQHCSALLSFTQDGEGVEAVVRDTVSGDTRTLQAEYLVGCDGYGSTVRDLLGIRMRGQEVLDQSLSIEFRTPHLAGLHDKGDAGRYVCIGPEGTWATCMTVNGKDLWRILLYRIGEDVRKVDVSAVVRRVVGRDFDFKIDSAKPWTRRAVIADRYQDGRVFIAGDAGHTHLPNGGFGMNTGVADASNLAWKLVAVLQQWAPPQLLESYDIERRPVAHRAMDEALKELVRLTDNTTYPDIEADSAAGAASRKTLGARMAVEYSGVRGWDRLGIHLGHIYCPSPIVVDDGTPLPEDDTWGYTPNTHPGARAPHAWLPDGRSLLDLFGRNHVLLRFGAAPVDATGLLAAAKQRGMAVDVHDIADPAIAALYQCRLALIRPDGHIAWRADTAPRDAQAIVDRVRGAGLRAASRVRIAA